MSITKRGVKFSRQHRRSRWWLVWLSLTEVVLSFFLYISMAANIIWPEQSQGAVGIAKVLSYEGRLTDTSGNPLGGSGTSYCFRFSIYDNPTVGSGTKLWPAGTPATTTATVTDGVFDAAIGSADSLTYNFYDSDTVYLNVEVNTVTSTCSGTWENLNPRQRIASTGYALTAGNVYGDLLKTDLSNNKVQVGTGTGVASGQKLLALDVKNASDTVGAACSPSGTLWYNSANGRALVCDNSTIQEVGNLATIVGLKEASAGSAISSGTVVLSGINGVSVSQNAQTISISGLNAVGISTGGNTLGTSGAGTGSIVLVGGNNITLSQATAAGGRTITISGAAGGGGGVVAFGVSNLGNTAGNTGTQTGTIVLSGQGNITLSQITGAGGVQTIGISAGGGGGGGFAIKDFALLDRAYMLAITNMTATGVTQRPIFVPFVLPGSLTWNRGDIEVSRATSGSNLFTADFGIYSYVNSTQISLMGSLRNTYSGTATASQSGIRRILFTGMDAGATALTPGAYVMGMKFSASAGTASMNYSLRGATLGPPAGNIFPGVNSYMTATSQLSSMPLARFLGRYTATSADLPSTVGFNQVQHWTSMYRVYFHLEST